MGQVACKLAPADVFEVAGSNNFHLPKSGPKGQVWPEELIKNDPLVKFGELLDDMDALMPLPPVPPAICAVSINESVRTCFSPISLKWMHEIVHNGKRRESE